MKPARLLHAVSLLNLIVILFFTPGAAFPQVYYFKPFTMREGLLSNDISALCQDSFGYLWIGNGDGISVYDGNSFRNYTVADGLGSSLVNCIIEDRFEKGTMWIGTNSGGVSRYRNGSFTDFRLGKSDWSERVNSIAQFRDGTILCATDGGLFIIRHDSVSMPAGKRFAGTFLKVLADSERIYLLGGDSVLSVYDAGRILAGTASGPPFRLHAVTEVFLDSGNRLWATLADGSLVDVFGKKRIDGFLKGQVNFILDDRDGHIWIGTWGGLYRVRDDAGMPRRPVRFTTANGLPDIYMNAGVVDNEGDLWLGIGGEGLYMLRNESTFYYAVKPWGIALGGLQGAGDRYGHVWISCRNEILEIWRRHDGSVASRIRNLSGLGETGRNVSLQVVGGDVLWVSSGLEMRSFRIVTSPAERSKLVPLGSYNLSGLLPVGSVLLNWVDRSGDIWMSVETAGVVEFSTRGRLRIVAKYSTAGGLPDNSIRAIFEDSRGNMWFGGYIGGVAELSGRGTARSLRLYNTNSGLPDNSVRSIAEDAAGKIWIGTRYGGLAVIAGDTVGAISIKDGLASDAVWSMSCAGDSGVILGTQLGLQTVDTRDGDIEPSRVIGERAPVYACGVTSTRLLWACNPDGVQVTDLSAKRHPAVPPYVRITGLLVNGRPRNSSSPLRLRYSENTVTFDFQGVTLRNEENLTYRYILHGADENWRVDPSAHSVTYVSLKPGEYTFEVVAVSPAGLRSVSPSMVSFDIVAPFWLRWWFIAGVAVLALALVYFAVTSRVRRFVEIQKVRARIATDLHDEIGSGLTRIAVLADVAFVDGSGEKENVHVSAESYERARNMVRRIANGARGLIDSMSDVIWSIDPKYDSLRDFVFYFRNYANEIAEARGIRLEIVADDSGDVKIGPQLKRTLQLVSKEALNNSIKYSGCRSITYTLSLIRKGIVLVYEDDGSGFEPGSVERGNGIRNMEKNARDLGGKFILESAPGSGTRIRFEIPIS